MIHYDPIYQQIKLDRLEALIYYSDNEFLIIDTKPVEIYLRAIELMLDENLDYDDACSSIFSIIKNKNSADIFRKSGSDASAVLFKCEWLDSAEVDYLHYQFQLAVLTMMGRLENLGLYNEEGNLRWKYLGLLPYARAVLVKKRS